MQNALPWIALGIAVLAIFVKDGVRPAQQAKPSLAPVGAYIILLLLVGLAMLAGWKWSAEYEGLFPSVTGFSIGAFMAAVAYGIGLLPAQTPAGRTAPIALATAAVAFAAWFPERAQFCLVFGAAAAAWVLSIGKSEEPNPWAMRAAVAAGAIVACNDLAAKSVATQTPQMLGTWIALAAAATGLVAGLVRLIVARGETKPQVADTLWIICIYVLLLGGVFLVLQYLGFQSSEAIAFGAGALIALIVSWLVPEDSPSSTVRLTIATVIWVASATVVFGYFKGFGMALTLLAASCTLLLLGNRRALLSLGMLAALVFYRVFREAHLDTTHAFDIGQHYAMIGLMIGGSLPVMAQEWLRVVGKRGGGASLLAGALWVLLLAGAPIVVAIALSDKGIIGYMIGLGFAAFIEGVRNEKSAHGLSLALGLGSMMILLYDWLQPRLDMDRHHKLIAMAWVGGIGLVAALVIALLSSKFREEPAAAPA